MKRRNSIFTIIATLLVVLFLYLPIVIMIIYSFNKSKLVAVWGGYSTKWYKSLFQNEEVLSAFIISLEVAVLNSIIAVVIGTLAAYSLSTYKTFKFKSLFSFLLIVPLVLPDVLIGISILLFFILLDTSLGIVIPKGITTITLAHSVISISFVTLIMRARLSLIDNNLRYAAIDLGAKPWQVFFLVIVPLLVPGLVSSFLLAFTLSLDDLIIASFVGGPSSTTLPILIFSKIRLGVNPEINALATVMLIAILIICLVATLLLVNRGGLIKKREVKQN